MSKKIGIYGGSFDPIHFGHLNLAIQILESRGLDSIIFCPSSVNPHKPAGSFASPSDRLNMIRLAIEEVPQFCLSEIEIHRSGPSYTIDTLHELLASQKEDEDALFLIIGSDAARAFHRWHLPEEIVKCAHLLIGNRSCETLKEEYQGSADLVQALFQGHVPTQVMEISSTEIRQRLAKGLFCGHLVPRKVLDYISSHHLYSISSSLTT